jgi:hypothetical protein
LRQGLDSQKVETRCKVGARRTAALCFLTPPSEPDVQVSKHPALQGLATSASSVTTGFVRFVAFAAAPRLPYLASGTNGWPELHRAQSSY